MYLDCNDCKFQVRNYMTEITLVYQKAKYSNPLGTQIPFMSVRSIGKRFLHFPPIHLKALFLDYDVTTPKL